MHGKLQRYSSAVGVQVRDAYRRSNVASNMYHGREDISPEKYARLKPKTRIFENYANLKGRNFLSTRNHCFNCLLRIPCNTKSRRNLKYFKHTFLSERFFIPKSQYYSLLTYCIHVDTKLTQIII